LDWRQKVLEIDRAYAGQGFCQPFGQNGMEPLAITGGDQTSAGKECVKSLAPLMAVLAERFESFWRRIPRLTFGVNQVMNLKSEIGSSAAFAFPAGALKDFQPELLPARISKFVRVGHKAKSPVLDGLDGSGAPPPRTGDSVMVKNIMGQLIAQKKKGVNRNFVAKE